MFKIILESVDAKQLDKVYEKNNVNYLVRDEENFEILGELSTCGYDVFSSDDMDKLLLELERLKEKVHEVLAVKHIEEIISLAVRCKETKGSRLIFTPF